MDSREFLIKSFEVRYPYILIIISEWEEKSIGWGLDYLMIVINRNNIPNTPENKYDSQKGYNLYYHFMTNICRDISSYLTAKGYEAVTFPDYEHAIYLSQIKQGMNGYDIKAYPKIPEHIKKLRTPPNPVK